MNAIDSIVENPMLQESHARQRAALIKRFPELSLCSHKYFLSLEKYFNGIPQKFYAEAVYVEYLAWMKDRDRNARSQLQAYLSEHSAEIDRSLLHLEEINRYTWHDSLQKQDDGYEIVRFIDQRVHPTYLRLVEAVFCPFLRMVAHFSRVDRGKGTEGLDVWSIIQEIQGRCFDEALRPYRHIVRNGIGHGGVAYLERAIRYRDKKGTEETLRTSEVLRICDDLLDVCNALALGLSIFLLARQVEKYELPKQLLIEELSAETRSPWWEIVGCVPTQFSGGTQLIVYARPQTSDYRKVQMSTFHSGVLAEQFAPGFDRYFFSIRAKRSWPGWAAFDGKKLQKCREGRHPTLADYEDVIENKLIFYVPWFRVPIIISYFETLLIAFKIHFPQALSDVRERFGIADINVRNTDIHRNSWGCVLNADVYISTSAEAVDQDTIRKSCRHIVSEALSRARQPISRLNAIRYLPLGFARIAVFRKNYRKRRLSNFGLGKNLICTVQVQRISRIQSPDILGSTIEKHGKYRIAWNRAWIDDIGG